MACWLAGTVGAVMDVKLSMRLAALRGKLFSLEDETPDCCKMEVGTLQTRRIIKKWKYRTGKDRKKSATNAFLPDNLQKPDLRPLYDNVMEIASKEYSGVDLYSIEQMLDRIRGISDGTNGALLAWDEKWVNPLSLASKGWQFHALEGSSTLVLNCCFCNTMIYLNLRPLNEESGEHLQQLINKRCWEELVSVSRCSNCPWKANQVNLRDYYLHDYNLISDLQRLLSHDSIDFNVEHNDPAFYIPRFLSEHQMNRLCEFFQCSDKLKLELLLRGYKPMESCGDAVVCVRCFRKAFVGGVVGSEQLNCHNSWCRYHNEKELASMILSLLENVDAPKDAKSRLKELESYLESLYPGAG